MAQPHVACLPFPGCQLRPQPSPPPLVLPRPPTDPTVVRVPTPPPEHPLPQCARPHVREHSAPYPTEPVPRLETAPGSVFVTIPPLVLLLYDSKEKGCVDEGRVAALGDGVCSCFGGMLLGGCRWAEDRF